MTHHRLMVVGVIAGAALTSATSAKAADLPPIDFSTTPPPPVQTSGSRTEIPDGTRLLVSEADALAASSSDCLDLKYCSWTGGYYTGPAASWTHGGSYNWGNYHVDQCQTSGTSGPIWKNCASSLRNRNSVYTANFYAQPNGSGYSMSVAPTKSQDQLGVFNNNIDSSTSS